MSESDQIPDGGADSGTTQLTLDDIGEQHLATRGSELSKGVDRLISPSPEYEVADYPNQQPRIDTDPELVYKTAVRYFNNLKNTIFTGDSPDDESIANNVLTHAGRYDGKNISNVSLSSHLLNVTLAGLSTFAYELAVYGYEDSFTDDEIYTLIAGLLLHDVDKYVNARYDESYDGNSKAVLDQYFVDDDFGLLDELVTRNNFNDLLYIILHTETGEDTSELSDVDIDHSIKDLARYTRIADSTCSAIQREGIEDGFTTLDRKYRSFDDSPVNLIDTYQTPRPLTQLIGLNTVKKAIEGHVFDDGAYGIVIGSTPNGILYLGKDLDAAAITTLCQQYSTPEIGEVADFSPKYTGHSFEYDTLTEVNIPVERKRELIAERVRSRLEAGFGMSDPHGEGLETIPDGVKSIFPDLMHRIYKENDYSASPGAGENYSPKVIGAVTSRAEDISSKNTHRTYLLAEMVLEYADNPSDVYNWAIKYRDDVDDLLSVDPSESSIRSVIDTFDPTPSGLDLDSVDADEMCFLCGEPTDDRFSKGYNAVFSTHQHSRRTRPNSVYKNICSRCNLEYTLLDYRVSEFNEVDFRHDVDILYLHPSDYYSYISDESTRPAVNISRGTIDIESVRTTDLFETQIQAIPFRTSDLYPSKGDRVPENQVRLSNLKEVFEYLDQTGTRATLGEPYRPFDATNSIFYDATATRLEERLGLAELEDRDELHRAIELLNILDCGYSRGIDTPYTILSDDEYLELVTVGYNEFDVSEYTPDDSKTTERICEYITEYHTTHLMNMKNVAKAGIELHGEIYGSKYKKGKVIRACLNELIDGYSRGMEDDALREQVAGEAYSVATRADYPGNVTHEQASTFVDELVSYLDAYNYNSIGGISDNLNKLVNGYVFAIDQLMQTDEIDSSDNDTEQVSETESAESSNTSETTEQPPTQADD
jgi:CRISPR-associated protein Csc3